MFTLDNDLLVEVGLSDLPIVEKNALLGKIYDCIEWRVGMTLTASMTEQQLDEFETYIDACDDEGALRWLQRVRPDFREVVATVLDELKDEIRAEAPRILAVVAGQTP